MYAYRTPERRISGRIFVSSVCMHTDLCGVHCCVRFSDTVHTYRYSLYIQIRQSRMIRHRLVLLLYARLSTHQTPPDDPSKNALQPKHDNPFGRIIQEKHQTPTKGSQSIRSLGFTLSSSFQAEPYPIGLSPCVCKGIPQRQETTRLSIRCTKNKTTDTFSALETTCLLDNCHFKDRVAEGRDREVFINHNEDNYSES